MSYLRDTDVGRLWLEWSDSGQHPTCKCETKGGNSKCVDAILHNVKGVDQPPTFLNADKVKKALRALDAFRKRLAHGGEGWARSQEAFYEFHKIFTFNGQKYVTLGAGHSVDRPFSRMYMPPLCASPMKEMIVAMPSNPLAETGVTADELAEYGNVFYASFLAQINRNSSNFHRYIGNMKLKACYRQVHPIVEDDIIYRASEADNGTPFYPPYPIMNLEGTFAMVRQHEHQIDIVLPTSFKSSKWRDEYHSRIIKLFRCLAGNAGRETKNPCECLIIVDHNMPYYQKNPDGRLVRADFVLAMTHKAFVTSGQYANLPHLSNALCGSVDETLLSQLKGYYKRHIPGYLPTINAGGHVAGMSMKYDPDVFAIRIFSYDQPTSKIGNSLLDLWSGESEDARHRAGNLCDRIAAEAQRKTASFRARQGMDEVEFDVSFDFSYEQIKTHMPERRCHLPHLPYKIATIGEKILTEGIGVFTVIIPLNEAGVFI